MIKRKLKEKNGESLVETLVSVLIACLAVTMLCGAIISASKVNKNTTDYADRPVVETDGRLGDETDNSIKRKFETKEGILKEAILSEKVYTDEKKNYYYFR